MTFLAAGSGDSVWSPLLRQRCELLEGLELGEADGSLGLVALNKCDEGLDGALDRAAGDARAVDVGHERVHGLDDVASVEGLLCLDTSVDLTQQTLRRARHDAVVLLADQHGEGLRLSFVDFKEENGTEHTACVLVANPPFSLKNAFIKRIYELGIPAFLLMPVDMLGTKRDIALLKGWLQNVRAARRRCGGASSKFYNKSEDRDMSVGTCAWLGLNLGTSGGDPFPLDMHTKFASLCLVTGTPSQLHQM